MDKKFGIALIALVGIGIFALPSTVALFAGQHSFYNIDATGNQVPCVKCHGDVKAELKSNGISGVADYPNTEGPHANFKCEYCHRAEAGYASGDNAYGEITYTDGTNTRVLAIPVYYFEQKAYPKIITGSDQIGVIGSFDPYSYGVGGVALSPTTAGVDFLIISEKLVPTYNRVTGQPIDEIPTTRFGGLNLSAATWSGTAINLNYSGSKAVNPGTKYHAASLVSCMECHGGSKPFGHYTRLTLNGSGECSNCHYGGSPTGALWTQLGAGGFNLTDDPLDTGETEAHNEFTNGNKGSGTNFSNQVLRYGYNTSNVACVGCHTHVAMDINFTKKYKIALDVWAKDTAGDSGWDIGKASAEGDVKISIFGNGSGETFATSNKTYNWDPKTTMYIVNDNGTHGAQVNGLTDASNDSKSALTQ